MEGEHVMDVANAVHEHVANVIAPSLPEGVEVDILNDESQVYAERANLLLKNGGLGLLLVLFSLALFLEIRLAVWVVVGLATSFVGALAVMLLLGVALNTISLFVFVLAIGIIVDDAIVVAEHIHLERSRGTPGVVAAIRGARRIKIPLTFAVLTSVVAFTPVFFVPGGIGEVWQALPIMIIAMLLISLFESLLILPNHLSHLHGPEWTPASGFDRFFARTQGLSTANWPRFWMALWTGPCGLRQASPRSRSPGPSRCSFSASPCCRRASSRPPLPMSWRGTSSRPRWRCRTARLPRERTR